MTKQAALMRQYITSTCRRSTSPQRRVPAGVSSLKRFTDIPGPLALPMLRHSTLVLPRIGSFHHTVGLGLLDGLQRKYGDIVRLAKAARSRPVLYVFDPEMMREVYESGATEPPKWDKSPLSNQRKSFEINCPVYNEDSKAIWAAIRSLLHDTSLLNNYNQVFTDIAGDFTRRLGELQEFGNALNDELIVEVNRWALETLGVAVLGIRLGCLQGNAANTIITERTQRSQTTNEDRPQLCSLLKRHYEDLTPAEQLVRCSLEISNRGYLVRSENTLRPELHTFKNALQSFDNHFSLTSHFVDQAIETLNSEDLKPEQVFLDKLQPLGKRIVPLAADVFLAGVEPLSQTALSLLYHLSLHAAHQQRAHDQVCWASETTKQNVPLPESHPGYLNAGDLPLIRACGKEALRLNPVTGGVVRRSTEDLEVGGYHILAGVDIVLAHDVTSRSEKQWVRANSYIPDRWCSEGWEPLRASKAHDLSSAPFGELCPASGLVDKILGCLTARVLEKYRLEWHGPRMEIKSSNKMKGPFHFVLQNAS